MPRLKKLLNRRFKNRYNVFTNAICCAVVFNKALVYILDYLCNLTKICNNVSRNYSMKRYVIMAVLGVHTAANSAAHEVALSIRSREKVRASLSEGQQLSPRLVTDKYCIGFNDKKTTFACFESTEVLSRSADSFIKVGKVEHFMVLNIVEAKAGLFIEKIREHAAGECLTAMRVKQYCFEWFQQIGDMPELCIATMMLKKRHAYAHRSPRIRFAREAAVAPHASIESSLVNCMLFDLPNAHLMVPEIYVTEELRTFLSSRAMQGMLRAKKFVIFKELLSFKFKDVKAVLMSEKQDPFLLTGSC